MIHQILPNFSVDYLKQIHSLRNSNTQVVLLPQGYCRAFEPDDLVLAKDFTEADQILPLVDIVIVSEQDSQNMLEDAKKWANKYGVLVVVTTGEKGALAIDKNQTIELPTRPLDEAEIVDSVGSGDIFSAGFSFRYNQTKDLKEAGRFANELARQCLFFPADKIRIDFKSLLFPTSSGSSNIKD